MIRHTLIGTGLALGALLLVAQPARASEPPGIRIWTDHGEVYRHAERFQVFFRTEHDAFVTVLRVDTNGGVHVLFPLDPGDPNLARGGETYTVPGVDDHDAFVVDDPPGVGYVYAIASDSPFVYDAFATNDRWDLETTASMTDGRIHGDPSAALQELAQNILPPNYADYDTHLLPYDVEQQYDYPRFLCYDCHAYAPYAYWDPYASWCPQFSLAVYYNPFYFYPSYWYPTRYYRGTNVVYVRPGIVGRQYVFRSRTEQSAPYAVYRDRRGGAVPAAPERGVRGVDIGGVGSVPAPGGRRTVGGGEIAPSGRRVVGGGAAPTVAPQESGRRYAREAIPEPVTNPRVVGPSPTRPSEVAAPVEARPRGVYIDPGLRQTNAPAVAGGAAAVQDRRYIAPASQGAREAPRGSAGYAPRGAGPGAASRSAGPSYAPRGGSSGPAPSARAAPRAAPAPRSAPALVRRRG